MSLIHFVGEAIPPTLDGRLKFCVDVSFMNTSLHAKSGQNISAPPDQPDQAQHTISQNLKNECFRVVKGIYGRELENAQFDSFRICWYDYSIYCTDSTSNILFRDGFTPNQDFVISSGGSFHGWKFLPIISDYVVQLLDEPLEEDLVKRWAWDRPQEGGAHSKSSREENGRTFYEGANLFYKGDLFAIYFFK